MQRMIFIGAVSVAAMALFALRAQAQVPSNNLVNDLYGLTICRGSYALCAASTCTRTAGTIDVNTATGTNTFPAASCTCPVFDGPAIADPQGGNMKGSCAPPGRGQVWSLYWPKKHVPQAANNWSRKPAETALSLQLCSSTDNVGATFANCFSFACTLDLKRQHGVQTATCLCPLGEDLEGNAVDPATAITTPAGQCDSNFCAEHPVGAPVTAFDGEANQCLGTVSGDQSDLMTSGN
jgi:hypothetical protein